ncbi:MAG: sensor histidine kinase [Crocinitomicaceae bacterium]|nr:sensor histidine kinase [Crocinitomicaceae bacterium]
MNFSLTQNLSDSLSNELNLLAQVDTSKFNILKEKWTKEFGFTAYDHCALVELEGNKYHYHGDDYTAKKLYMEANSCAHENNNKEIELSTRIKIIWLDLGIGVIKTPEAIIGAKRALSDASEAKDTNRMIMALNALASFHIDQGKKDEAYEFFYEALKISQNPKYYLNRATILNNLGLHKTGLGLQDEALKDFKEGLKLVENKREYRIQTRLINNIAFLYNREDSTMRDSAFYYFNKTLELGKIINEPQLYIVAYTNLAVYYNLTGDFNSCRQYYDSALNVIDQFDMVGIRARIYLGLAEFYRRQQKYYDALNIMKTGWEHIEKENYPKLEDMVSYERLFSRLYEATGKHNLALEHYKNYNTYRDSLRELDNQKFLAELNLKYEDEKRLVEIEKQKSRADLLEKENEIIQTESSLNMMRNTLIFTGIILLIGLFFSIYVIRSTNAKKRMEQKYASNLISEIEDERRRISSDLHDHIGLNLIMVKNQLSERIENDKLVKEVSNIVEDVRKISRNIYPSELNKLGVKKSIEAMFDKIENSTGILTSYEIEDLDQVNFNKGEELILYRIVQELSNNSIKHSKSKSIRIVAQVTPKKLNLEYRDNGIGFDKSKILETSNGMGLRNIINRVEKIGGTIQFDSKKNQGVKVTISFDRQL